MISTLYSAPTAKLIISYIYCTCTCIYTYACTCVIVDIVYVCIYIYTYKYTLGHVYVHITCHYAHTVNSLQSFAQLLFTIEDYRHSMVSSTPLYMYVESSYSSVYVHMHILFANIFVCGVFK